MGEDLAGHPVGVPEREAPLHQVFGEVGREEVPGERGTHPFFRDPHRPDGALGDRQCEPERVQGVEAGFLVFLQVALVAGGEALPDCQQGHQVADQAAGLPPDQLEAVGVSLLGHEARPRGPGVVEPHESEFGGRPEDEVLGEPGEVHPQDGPGGEELHRVVPRPHRVHAVLEHLGEAEFGGDGLAIHRIGVSGERSRPHRRSGGPPAGGFEPLPVARQGPEMGKQEVAEHHRLGALEVRVPRDQCVPARLGPGEEHAPQPVERLRQPGGRAREIEPEFGLGEIVAAPSGRQLAGQLADLVEEHPLDRGVDVLVVEGRRRIGGERGADPVEPGEHPVEFAGIQHPRPGQGAGIGLVDADLFRVEPPVEVHRLPQPVEGIGGRRGEPPAPELHDSPSGASAPDSRRIRSGRPKRRMKPSASACRYTSSAPKVAKSSR